jgi:hypothetical protein
VSPVQSSNLSTPDPPALAAASLSKHPSCMAH